MNPDDLGWILPAPEGIPEGELRSPGESAAPIAMPIAAPLAIMLSIPLVWLFVCWGASAVHAAGYVWVKTQWQTNN